VTTWHDHGSDRERASEHAQPVRSGTSTADSWIAGTKRGLLGHVDLGTVDRPQEMAARSSFARRADEVRVRVDGLLEQGIDLGRVLEIRQILVTSPSRWRSPQPAPYMISLPNGSGKSSMLAGLAMLTQPPRTLAARRPDGEPWMMSSPVLVRVSMPFVHGMRMLRDLADRHTNLCERCRTSITVRRTSDISPVGGMLRSVLRRLVRALAQRSTGVSDTRGGHVFARFAAAALTTAWLAPLPEPPDPPGHQVTSRRRQPRGPNLPRICQPSAGVVAA